MGKLLQLPVRPAPAVEHDRCPRCGTLNGPSERLGSGICNECLDRRSRRARRPKRSRRKRPAAR